MPSDTCDIAILGGGLAGGLLALALRAKRPALRVLLIEQGAHFGGNHIWSFFDSDIAPEHRALVEPLIAHSWQGYDVHFPAHSRELGGTYNSITSEQFDTILHDTLPADACLTGCSVRSATPTHVTLDDGRTIAAGGVIDTRGTGNTGTLNCGWQKFMGQHLHLAAPHVLERPIVMDARVPQIDGYRFVYCLPFGPRDVFVEDTYYSDTPDLDMQVLSARISDYAAGRGWEIAATDRTETGVLPVVTGGNFNAYWDSTGPDMAKAGARAGLFHPLTSYSLPDAVRFAYFVAAQNDLSGPALAAASHAYAQQVWRGGRYYRMLTKMLFEAADPEKRYIILQRFYTLDEKLIRRFYAGKSGWTDKLRVLAGKPPVKISRAISALLNR